MKMGQTSSWLVGTNKLAGRKINGSSYNNDGGLVQISWLGGRDSNPDSQIQSLESYHWTTSQQRNRIYVTPLIKSTAHVGMLDSYPGDNFRRCGIKSFRK